MKSYSQSSIETDRPDQTETSATVPKGRFQAEFGLSHEQEDRASRAYALPTSLLKFGLSKSVELRLELEWNYEDSEGEIANGRQPLVIGTKVKLWEEKGIRPAVSVLAQVALPKAASKDFELDHAAPEIRLLLQNKLSDAADLGYNAGVEWDGLSSPPKYLYTLSPNYEITEHLKAFAETYGYFQSGHHSEQWIDGGFSLLLSDDVQLDFSAGYELTHTWDFHNFFESVGFSFRI